MNPRHLIMISALNRTIADVYAMAGAGGRDRLTAEERDAVRALDRRILMLRATEDAPPTGPYATREDLFSALRRSAFPKVLGRFVVCLNADGSWAWYCREDLMRERDHVVTAMIYDPDSREYEECPLS